MDNSTSLDYAGVLSKLLALQGRSVDVSVRGADGTVPLCLFLDGRLRTSGFPSVDSVGYHRDTLAIFVGDAVLTLHPGHFASAVWTEDDDAASLHVVFGGIEFGFRAIEDPAAPDGMRRG